jgi:riboflavin synthase
MFTGIVEQKKRVTHLKRTPDSLELGVESDYSDLALGESVAVNGVCLTVTHSSPEGECFFFLSAETLSKSNLSQLQLGDFLNLERALTPQTRLSGHWVQGHVDGLGTWLGAPPSGLATPEVLPATTSGNLSHLASPQAHPVTLRVPAGMARYCVEKGSICVNGVSLTINSLEPTSDGTQDCLIQITLIPHTWEATNLSHLNPGDPVNLEADILAKYVERLCRTH